MGEAKKRGSHAQRVALATQITEFPSSPHLFSQTWLHGTDSTFSEFAFPPPQKKGDELSVAHTAVFLTLHQDYAEAAGKGLCSARLNPSARVLDLTVPSRASEMLRKEVCKNELARFSIFINDTDRWIEGWQTGDVLRFAFNDPQAGNLMAKHVMQLVNGGMSREVAFILAQHNVTRGLIELICSSARDLGLDAIYGHEVDRHAGVEKIARPWLAVLRSETLCEFKWIHQSPANLSS